VGSLLKPGQIFSLGVPSSLNILSSCSSSVPPLSSGSLDNSSAMMQPKLHASMAVEYRRVPSSNSGARYHSVTTMCVYGRSGEPY
jgi:hypothetical protein